MMSRAKGENSRYFHDGRARSGNTYALLPCDVLQSEAYAAQPDYAARVLFALAAQFRKANNGDLSLTAAEALRYGISAEWKLRAGLASLEIAGLLEVTRRGHIQQGRGICSLYALGWRQIDASDKHDQPRIIATAAPMRWAKWTRPADWDQQVLTARHRAQGKRVSRLFGVKPGVAA
jgi:hypothetical protein